jgi:hypothetical protein
VFLADGTFLPLPKLATEPFLKLWEQEVFALLLAEGKITEQVVANIRSWRHSGFSVDQSVRLEGGDQQGVQRLIQYFLRCPFSQARMIEVTEAGKVIYKTEHNAVGRFPEPGDEELLAGPSRNFQVFDPLDFLAEVTQHIPDPRLRPRHRPRGHGRRPPHPALWPQRLRDHLRRHLQHRRPPPFRWRVPDLRGGKRPRQTVPLPLATGPHCATRPARL